LFAALFQISCHSSRQNLKVQGLSSDAGNANNVARMKAIVKQNLKCQNRNHKHAWMKNDEQAVQDILFCLTEFEADPFDESNPQLRSLQSGLVASNGLIKDFKTAPENGRKQTETLLQERVFTKTKQLIETIHKNKRRNFTSEQVRSASGTPMTVANMEKSGLAALLDLADGSGAIKLESALERRVTIDVQC